MELAPHQVTSSHSRSVRFICALSLSRFTCKFACVCCSFFFFLFFFCIFRPRVLAELSRSRGAGEQIAFFLYLNFLSFFISLSLARALVRFFWRLWNYYNGHLFSRVISFASLFLKTFQSRPSRKTSIVMYRFVAGGRKKFMERRQLFGLMM